MGLKNLNSLERTLHKNIFLRRHQLQHISRVSAKARQSCFS